jgi:hypothetical protein
LERPHPNLLSQGEGTAVHSALHDARARNAGNILVTGGNGDGNAANGLMAALTGMFAKSLNAPTASVAATEAASAKPKS